MASINSGHWLERYHFDAGAYLSLRQRLQVDEMSFGRDLKSDGIAWAWRIGTRWRQTVTDDDGPEVTIATLQAIIRLTE